MILRQIVETVRRLWSMSPKHPSRIPVVIHCIVVTPSKPCNPRMAPLMAPLELKLRNSSELSHSTSPGGLFSSINIPQRRFICPLHPKGFASFTGKYSWSAWSAQESSVGLHVGSWSVWHGGVVFFPFYYFFLVLSGGRFRPPIIVDMGLKASSGHKSFSVLFASSYSSSSLR